MDAIEFERKAPGLFVVRYASEDDLAPERQDALLAAARSEGGPVAIVFVLAPDVWKVDLAVPRFWAGVISGGQLPLRAIAVVSDSIAVRAATHTFRVMVMMMKRPLAVASMSDEDGAVAWAREQLQVAKAG